MKYKATAKSQSQSFDTRQEAIDWLIELAIPDIIEYSESFWSDNCDEQKLDEKFGDNFCEGYYENNPKYIESLRNLIKSELDDYGGISISYYPWEDCDMSFHWEFGQIDEVYSYEEEQERYEKFWKERDAREKAYLDRIVYEHVNGLTTVFFGEPEKEIFTPIPLPGIETIAGWNEDVEETQIPVPGWVKMYYT